MHAAFVLPSCCPSGVIRMSRKSKIGVSSMAVIAILILLYVHGCEHEENASISFPPPLGNVEFRSFWILEWVTSPLQDITIRLQQDSDLKQLVDLRVFGNLQPDMSDEEVIASFGEPTQRWTDDFGGTWSSYPTPFGYVKIGLDRRTSPTDDGDKGPIPGRHSLQAFTDKPPEVVFRPLLVEVLRRAMKLTPRADAREFSVFDFGHNLLLDVWVKDARIERMELFKSVDR